MLGLCITKLLCAETVAKEKKEVEDKSGKMKQLLLKQKKELEELRKHVSGLK